MKRSVLPHFMATMMTPLVLLLSAAPTASLVRHHQPPWVGRTAHFVSSCRASVASAIRDSTPSASHRSGSGSLPPELTPITTAVFSQMLGEGIAMSSLPLYLTGLGAQPLMVGLAVSCFSVSQMTFAPIMVGLSSKIGRSRVMQLCLVGAAASSLLIGLSGTVTGVVAGRALAGVFAACVPVAQSGVTELLPRKQAALGLSRVSAASQLGIMVGPAASALLQAAFNGLGIAPSRGLPAVFVLTAAVMLGVLAQMVRVAPRLDAASEAGPDWVRPDEARAPAEGPSPSVADEARAVVTVRPLVPPSFAQPMLRSITMIIGWTAVLSNSMYGLFAPRFLGFGQAQLSATYSTAAALAISAQLVFPRLVARLGEHRLCALGIVGTGVGIGGQALLRSQPAHSALYMLSRASASVADTATAALVVRSSTDRQARAKNLALLTSTRAAARIATPLISSKLFEFSCRDSVAPGALPFVAAACFALVVAPMPLVLHPINAERNEARPGGTLIH